MAKYDVAVVGVGVGANYGSALTYYAITETIRRMGYSVVLVNKIGGSPDDVEISNRNPSFLFANKYNIVSDYLPLSRLDELNEISDTFVIGTDQVWGDKIASFAGEAFYLGFANNEKRKISIAGSFGHFDDFSSIRSCERRRELFQRFNMISVRETDGVDILRNKYNVKSTQIIEPVFYIDNQDWYKIADNSNIPTDERYILVYILDINDEKKSVIDTISSKLNIPIKTIPDGFWNVIHGGDTNYKFSPEDFLKLVRDASYVITDSFHGTSFAIKFNKNFISLVNPARGVSRFDTLIRVIGAEERIIKDYSDVTHNPDKYLSEYDFQIVNEKIKYSVEKAKDWIGLSLKADVHQSVDIIDVYSDLLEKKIQGKRFTFGRSDIGVVYTNKLTFNEDNTIGEYFHENERYWKIFGDRLYIYSSEGTFSSSFWIKDGANSSIIELTGSGRDNKNSFFLRQALDEAEEVSSNYEDIKEYITSKKFSFYRKNGGHHLLSDSVSFNKNGEIEGLPPGSSSKYWKLSADGTQLSFIKNDNQEVINMKLRINEEKILYGEYGFYNKIGHEHIVVENAERDFNKSIDVGGINEELKLFLTNRSFDVYVAKDTKATYSSIHLSNDGKVFNFEKVLYWSIHGGNLNFHDDKKNIIYVFDISKTINDSSFSKFRSTGACIAQGDERSKLKYVMYLNRINSQKATPSILFSRIELIQSIRRNSEINSWRNDLLSICPDLELYIGRELKEYARNFVGGPADILVFPKNKDAVSQIASFAHKRMIPLTVIGFGSNILIRDGGIRGIVLNTSKINHSDVHDNILSVGAGASLIDVSYKLLEMKKSGLEWANNIPGSVGGAVFMNAGANKSIGDMFIEATVIDNQGEVKTVTHKDIIFKHRYSSFMGNKNLVIVEAKLRISDGDPDMMSLDMAKTVRNRENKHSLENPNNGSTFTWWRAARIIEQAGLVGTRIGGVEISSKFPNFFLNVNKATAADYEALIYHVIAEVYKYSGFLMTAEVRILGQDMWEATEYLK